MSSRRRQGQKNEIHAEGRVHLGEILHLVEVEPANDPLEYELDYVENSVMPAYKRSPVRRPSSSRSRRADFSYELKPSGEQLYLENDGMLLQYGILGGPGSGKTNLLTYLLRQFIVLGADKRDRRHFRPAHQFGGIILDPKAALIDDVLRAFQEADREEDLVIINSRELKQRGGINLIDCMLAPKDLAKVLVLAAQSAGIGGREQYWFQQMANAFGAMLSLLEFLHGGKKPTLKDIMEAAVGSTERERPRPQTGSRLTNSHFTRTTQNAEPDRIRETRLDQLMYEARAKLPPPAGAAAITQLRDARTRLEELQDERIALEVLSRHGAADPRNRITVEQFMEQAFGMFRDSAYECYSTESPAGGKNLYDQVVDEGKVILVSPGSQELTLSAMLPALVKLIFQRIVLSRFDRFANWELHNDVRPLLFLADEYHTVATQIPGERIGDGEYFSMARQFGGLCLVATQTVKQLETSGLQETWQAVFGTLAAVIGMKQEDADTIEYLQQRGGKKDVLQTTQGFSTIKGEVTITENTQRVEVPKIPAAALKLFRQGHAVVIGTTTDHKTPASIRYVQVPKAWPDEADAGQAVTALPAGAMHERRMSDV